jgi:hypothetical protein
MELSKKIITTLAYYDIIDYPMSSFEIWKYLISCRIEYVAQNTTEEEIALADIVKILDGEESKRYIDGYRGFYFLKGRQNLVGQRIERNKISEVKCKHIKKAARWLRYVPFVRLIAITGKIAMKNATRKSDLDLLVVLEKGHIFTGRLLVTLAVHLLGIRRYGDKITDRVCLNYFITDKSLEIEMKNLFSSSEYSFITPVFGKECFRKFQEQNIWIKEYKDNYRVDGLTNLKMMDDSGPARFFRKWGEIFFSSRLIEGYLKQWQMKRIANDPRTKAIGSMVSADDNSLVFLPEPQGPRIFEKFRNKLDKLALD